MDFFATEEATLDRIISKGSSSWERMRRFWIYCFSSRVLLPPLFFFQLLVRSTVSQLSEKEILLQFKGNISADPFNRLNSWEPNRNPCEDYLGVHYNSVENVEKIVLWNASLAGVLSTSLSGLKSLRILLLYGNRFTGNVLVEFAEIATFWKLNLSSNALSGVIPECLGDFESLRLLDLSRNEFIGEIPSALFRNCFRTKFLSLSGTFSAITLEFLIT